MNARLARVAGHVRGMNRERWMASCFAIGSACFLVGPFPGYATLVGETADAITFFVGSIFFTAGGALQTVIAASGSDARGADGAQGSRARRAALWAAAIQSAGTVFFNLSTYRAMHTALSSPEYNRLVWRPDTLGSICFLLSGTIAYSASARAGWRGWRPERAGRGWWEPAVNLLGCAFFGISAIAGYVVPSSGSVLNLAAANFNTSLGAACFLACALETLRSGRTTKSPRQRLARLEHAVVREIDSL
jgi:hypothetical protein